MKSVVSRISLLLAALYFTGTLATQPVQAQGQAPQAQTEPPNLRAIDRDNLTVAVPLIEQNWEKEFEQYFKTNLSNESTTVKKIAETLRKIEAQTGKTPALIYMLPRSQQLELILITPDGKPIHKRVSQANRKALQEQVQEFTRTLINPTFRNTNQYLAPAQQLYQWMIAPLEADLQAQHIDTLMFCVGGGLRTLPLAALHDGKQFLVEKYSFSRIPAFKLTNTIYADLRQSRVLAMGASQFQDQNPLPAVPVEISSITRSLWQGKSFLNQEFTLANLRSQLVSQPYQIIHLATHAAFQPGEPNNSYIQFWDKKLTLDQMRQLHENNPQLELLVLSACETAIGDEQAELGFAGLAVQARAKSAIASLWQVSDAGTLGLMTQFYQELKTAPIKAEALRQAQITMLKGQVRLEGGKLRTPNETIPLPPELAKIGKQEFSSPYYWAAFTMVGSPW
ncbi:CHAT domain-containing protein [Allocoleopsis sp.]|uniref:CHAT domain-containing protein n=1 Tax=Allocoleopsis sp. TaxID=3088169 RepID=UPI002FD6D5E9